MNFTVINKELDIQACSLKEMSQDVMDQFAAEYVGDNINILVSFYNPNTDTIVLNADNEYFELYKALVPAYMECKKETRAEARKETPEEFNDTLDFLENIATRREEMKAALELKRLLGKQSLNIYYEALDMLQALKLVDSTHSEPQSNSFSEYNAFMYGYISGIRADRARRKRGIVHE